MKERVSSDMSTCEGHDTLQKNQVQETSFKPSKLNENNTIKWCPKNAVHTQTLERLNVSPQCQERTLFEVPQKLLRLLQYSIRRL